MCDPRTQLAQLTRGPCLNWTQKHRDRLSSFRLSGSTSSRAQSNKPPGASRHPRGESRMYVCVCVRMWVCASGRLRDTTGNWVKAISAAMCGYLQSLHHWSKNWHCSIWPISHIVPHFSSATTVGHLGKWARGGCDTKASNQQSDIQPIAQWPQI